MNKPEVDQVLDMLNEAWPGKPLGEAAAALWGASLRRHPFDAVMRVLVTKLETSKWRPSLAELLEPLSTASKVKSAYAAFETVWDTIPRRPREVSELEQRAVDRLGGWHVLGNWELAQRQWHFKAFKEVYDDLTDSEHDEGLRAIAGGQQRALGEAK